MNILICGNLGYIGPVLTKHLRLAIPICEITGLDTGYFSSRISSFGRIGDTYCHHQVYQDIRDVSTKFLTKFDYHKNEYIYIRKIMRKQLIIVTLIIAGSLALASCARQVTRVNSNTQIDISGRWNDTDSRLAAEELTDEILNGDWLTDFMQANEGKKPVLIVGLVRNKSHEHIESETFIKDIEKVLIKKQSYIFVSLLFCDL